VHITQIDPPFLAGLKWGGSVFVAGYVIAVDGRILPPPVYLRKNSPRFARGAMQKNSRPGARPAENALMSVGGMEPPED
jgi:hypothetical protein